MRNETDEFIIFLADRIEELEGEIRSMNQAEKDSGDQTNDLIGNLTSSAGIICYLLETRTTVTVLDSGVGLVFSPPLPALFQSKIDQCRTVKDDLIRFSCSMDLREKSILEDEMTVRSLKSRKINKTKPDSGDTAENPPCCCLPCECQTVDCSKKPANHQSTFKFYWI